MKLGFWDGFGKPISTGLGVSGIGGGTPMSAPTAAMGWREYWNWMDITKSFLDDGLTQITADGLIYRTNGNLGVVANSQFTQTTETNRPTYKTGGANGKSYASFDGADNFMASLAISNFLANNAKTLIFVASINTGYANADRPYFDSGGWFGATLSSTGPKILAYNFDTTADQTAGQLFTADAPLVYVMKHDTGKIYDAKNGIVWGTGVDSGNTGNMAGLFRIGPNGTQYPPMSVYAMMAANVVISDANLTLVINYFKSQLAIA